VYFWRQRRQELPFHWLYLLFAVFILACGSVHLVEAIIFWWPIYRIGAGLKMITAIASWLTVVALIRATPEALRLPGLAETNRKLESEIDERRRLEADLRRSQEAANAANVAKSRFLANVSHEIRTPMTAVLGHAELLKSQPLDVKIAQSVETIKRNGEYLVEIVNELLDIARIEANKLELEVAPCDLPELLTDIETLMGVHAAEAGLDWKVSRKGTIPRNIPTDATRLKQVLVNLVGNAIKYTPEGSVELTVERTMVSGQHRVMFAIADTGEGISEQDLEHLFEPFYRVKTALTREFSGCGLGLTISYELVQLLGGRLEVHSKPGMGTTFSFDLPAGSSPMEDGEPKDVGLVKLNVNEEPASKPQRRMSGHVLVVDDNRDIRFLARHMLELAGASITTADDGEEAIDMVRQAQANNTPFDAILLDMQMPRLDGYDTVKALRSMGITTPVVALTASAMEGDREKCLEVGCNDYLTKPIDSQQLLDVMARQIADIKVER
jgi:signal transduction histidine kinase/CheY-like chemotaxis protein